MPATELPMTILTLLDLYLVSHWNAIFHDSCWFPIIAKRIVFPKDHDIHDLWTSQDDIRDETKWIPKLCRHKEKDGHGTRIVKYKQENNLIWPKLSLRVCFFSIAIWLVGWQCAHEITAYPCLGRLFESDQMKQLLWALLLSQLLSVELLNFLLTSPKTKLMSSIIKLWHLSNDLSLLLGCNLACPQKEMSK